MGGNGGVKCESEVCMCSPAPTGSLIDRPSSPTSRSQPASVIDSQGPGDGRPCLGSQSLGSPKGWPGGAAGGEGQQFPGPLTQVKEPISSEAFTAGCKSGGSHSLHEQMKATSAAARLRCVLAECVFECMNARGEEILVRRVYGGAITTVTCYIQAVNTHTHTHTVLLPLKTGIHFLVPLTMFKPATCCVPVHTELHRASTSPSPRHSTAVQWK